MILRAQNLSFAYQPDRPVLRSVSLDVCPGQVTAMFGPNGCGKSTLLRCMNNSLRPQSGEITLDGRQMGSTSAGEIARRIAVVPQDTPADVPFTAEQMVLLGRHPHQGLWGEESPQDRRIARDSLKRMNALDLAPRPFSTLSGGERQRVVIARALAQQGHVLLLDEPVAHLDIAHQLELYRMVRQLAREGQAILMVCHDILIAPMSADTAVLMHQGAVLSAGPPQQVLASTNIHTAFGAAVDVKWSADRSLFAAFG